MVMTITAFASLFQDLGLSAATVQRAEITPTQSTALFWMNVAVASVITVILIACAPLVAAFFRRPELVAVTAVLAVNILLTSFGAQHAALLTRDMKFGYLATARLAGSVAQFVASFLAAIAGLQYWALVLGMIAATLIYLVVLWYFSAWRPGLPSRSSRVRGMVHYGIHLTFFDLVNYFSRNLDNILVGRFWGAEALGYYTKAYSLLLFPISNLRSPIVSVAMPALSRLQSDAKAFRNYYCRMLAILAFFTMPLAAYCVVCSDQIVMVLLGPRWVNSAEIAQWLAVSSFLQPAFGLFGVVLTARGFSKRYFQCGVVMALVITAAFCIGVARGPVLMAKYYAAAQYMLMLPVLWFAFQGTGISVCDFLSNVYRQAACAIVSGAITALARKHASVSVGIDGLTVTLCLYSVLYLVIYGLVPGGLSELRYFRSKLASSLRTDRAVVA
jgi:PST family polysaccharide transporter